MTIQLLKDLERRLGLYLFVDVLRDEFQVSFRISCCDLREAMVFECCDGQVFCCCSAEYLQAGKVESRCLPCV